MTHEVVLIPGDGIGPEVAEATRHVLQAAGADIVWVERLAGISALESGAETVLPAETVEALRVHRVGLKGPASTPVGGGFSSINVALRKQLQLYGAVRPVRSMPGVETRYRDVDLIVVRENTEGLYAGIENEITPGVVTSLKVATVQACSRIARFGFDLAERLGRRKITALHKANIMKLSDGLFLQCAREERDRRGGSIVYDEMIIDAACMRIVQDPSRFDVLLCENLYGDVVSDLCAGLVGGLGVTPGANFGDEHALFEAVHGSAPDIAGRGIANPLALILSAVMMLEHLALSRSDAACGTAAARIRATCEASLVAGRKTRDLGGSLSTMDFAREVAARLG